MIPLTLNRSQLHHAESIRFFLINSGPDLVARDDLAARIAKAAGTKRIVKLSTMDVEQRVGTGVWHVVFRGEVIPFLLNS